MSIFCWILAAVLNLLWFVLEDRLSVGTQLAVPVLTAALLGMGALLRGGQARRAAVRRALWALLLYYLALLAAGLFFGGLFHLERSWGGAVQLEPLRTIRNFLIHYRRTGSLSSLANLLGNAVILIPLGVLLPVMFRPMRRFWVFLPLAALVSVGIEWLQYVTATGVADVDDSILNFAGAAAGYFATRLGQIVKRKAEKHLEN